VIWYVRHHEEKPRRPLPSIESVEEVRGITEQIAGLDQAPRGEDKCIANIPPMALGHR
jgi:hypothetical protein